MLSQQNQNLIEAKFLFLSLNDVCKRIYLVNCVCKCPQSPRPPAVKSVHRFLVKGFEGDTWRSASVHRATTGCSFQQQGDGRQVGRTAGGHRSHFLRASLPGAEGASPPNAATPQGLALDSCGKLGDQAKRQSVFTPYPSLSVASPSPASSHS